MDIASPRQYGFLSHFPTFVMATDSFEHARWVHIHFSQHDYVLYSSQPLSLPPGSDGEPRNLISPTRHVEDWLAAVEYARASGYKHVVAHGTSYGGGHVLVAASRQMNVSCVISQVPFVGGPESTKKNVVARGIIGVLRIFHTYLKDTLHGLIGWEAGATETSF
eukprot:117599-Pyramimonas_sp.AAC.1